MVKLMALEHRALLFKIIFLGLLVGYLAGSAMMLKEADLFLYTLFVVSLFKLSSFLDHFKNSEIFRFFTVILILIFSLVFLSSLFSLPFDFLFSYKFEVFRNLLLLPIIFNALFAIKITQKELLLVITLVGSYTFFYALAVFWEGSSRSVGLLTGPIQRGNLAVIYAVLALIIVYFAHARWQKIMAFIIFISGIVLSMQTGSKGGWLALVISFSTLFILFSLYDRRQLFFLLLKVASLVLVVFLLWDFLPVQGRLEYALKGLVGYLNNDTAIDGSVGVRLEIWKVTLLAIQQFDWDRLIFGQGFMSFIHHFEQAQKEGVTQLSLLAAHPHNDFLKIVFEFGLLGVALFSVIFIYPLMLFFKKLKEKVNFYHALAGILLIEMLLEFMLTDSAVFTKQLLYTYLFLIFMLLISFKNTNPTEQDMCEKKQNIKSHVKP